MRYQPIFKMQNNIILVPFWIYEELHRHGLSMESIIDFPKIRPILSMNDLLSLLACQKLGKEVFGSEEIVRGSLGITCDWTCSAKETEQKEIIRKSIDPLAEDASYVDSVRERLLNTDYPSYDVRSKEPFYLHPVGDSAMAVVVNRNGFISKNLASSRVALIRAILRQLYVFEELTAVNQSSMMRLHLSNLAAGLV